MDIDEKTKKPNWRKSIYKDNKYGGIIRHLLDAKLEGNAIGCYVIVENQPSMKKANWKPDVDNYADDGSFQLMFLHGIENEHIYTFQGVAFAEFDAVLDFLKTHAVNHHWRSIEDKIRSFNA